MARLKPCNPDSRPRAQSPDLCRAAPHSDSVLGAKGGEASQAAEGGGCKNVRGILVLTLLRSKAGLWQGGHGRFPVRGVLSRRIQQGMVCSYVIAITDGCDDFIHPPHLQYKVITGSQYTAYVPATEL